MKLYLRVLFLYALLFFTHCVPETNKNKNRSPKYHPTLVQKINDSIQSPQHQLLYINKVFQKYPENIKDNGSEYLSLIAKKSALHYKLKQTDSTVYYDRFLLQQALVLVNDTYIGKAHAHLGLYFHHQGIYDSAFYHYNASKAHFLKLNDSTQVGRRYMSMAILQKNAGDYFGSKETITASLAYLPKSNTKSIASAYNTLATNHRKLFNYEDAISYYTKAIQITSIAKDQLAYLNNIATVYIDTKQYAKAIAILTKITANTVLKDAPKQYARAIDNLAYAQWLAERRNVEQELKQALRIRILHNDTRGQISSYLHLGRYYLEKNPKNAGHWIEKALFTAKNYPRSKLKALKLGMQLQPKNSTLQQQYIQLNDSLYQQELKVKTQFAKIKYDDERKEKKIQKLTAQKARQTLVIAKERTQKLLSIVIVIVTIFGAGFIFYVFKQRNEKLHQQNRIIQSETIQATEARIAKQLHDELANDTFLVKEQLEKNPNDPKLLQNFEVIYNSIRDLSRTHSECDTGPAFPKELKYMLNSYMTNSSHLVILGLKKIHWKTINDTVKITIYRVLQELMTNMKKYSQAKGVSVIFSATATHLTIKYKDNGIGVCLKTLQNYNGLKNTENRIHALQGTIIFDSEINTGFRAHIQIPY